MKIFGGFGGKHHHGREPEKAIPEPEELSPAAAAEPGEDTLQADPVHEPDEISADAASEEAVSAETISEEMSADEMSAEETVRTPEEQAEIDEMIRRYQHKKRVRRWVIIGVIVAVLAAGYIIYKSTVKPPDIVQPSPPANSAAPATVRPSSTPSGIPEATPEPTEEPGPEVRERVENNYSILLLGSDQGNGNTDTIMICRFDANEGVLNILSIPRDTCANVDSNEKNNETKKISGIYARAGVEGVMEAAGDIIGAPIDGYIKVSIKGFIQLVDTIGGIDFNVPYYMNYDDPTQDLHIHYNSGMQHLDEADLCR